MLIYDKPTGDTHNSPRVWNKYAKIKKNILTEAVLAPSGIDKDPKDKIPNPKANKIKPIPNLNGPEGLNLLCQIFDKTGAKTII